MSYSNLMRSAAKILFVFAVLSFIGTLLVAGFVGVRSGGTPAFFAGLVGAIGSAATPFLGAAILWRLDILLLERSDRT